MLTVSSCENDVISIITYYIINDLTWEKKLKSNPLTWLDLNWVIQLIL